MNEGPWRPSSAASAGEKRHAPATLRNRDAILDVLQQLLPPTGLVLEIASGSGEHAIHFSGLIPQLEWQASDPDPAALRSIAAWRAEVGLPNLRPPLMLDASAPSWPVDHADALFCANMVHISPWAATLGLLAGAARILPAQAPLILYGPYFRSDVETAPSNLAFDAQLRSQNPSWGIRHLEEVDAAAAALGFARTALFEMPANNLMLAYRLQPRP